MSSVKFQDQGGNANAAFRSLGENAQSYSNYGPNVNPQSFNPQNFGGPNVNPQNFNPQNFGGPNVNPQNFNPQNFGGPNVNPQNFNSQNFNAQSFRGPNVNPQNFNSQNFNSQSFNSRNFNADSFRSAHDRSLDDGWHKLGEELTGGETHSGYLSVRIAGEKTMNSYRYWVECKNWNGIRLLTLL